MRKLLLTTLLLLFALPSYALVNPDEELKDPALEARAREISKDIRCPVCESQNIENSNAGVARDLRLLIRERLVAGDTDEQVIAYLTARYGDEILLDPPLNENTLALWYSPFIVLVFGGIAAVLTIKKAKA